MVWLADDILIKKRRTAGRPEENPFPSAEMEEDFSVRGQKMIELYYDASDPKSKTNFIFSQHKRISKTLFWSIIYIYYIEDKKLITSNLQGFLTVMRRHFPESVVSDRTSLQKKIGSLNAFYVHHRHTTDNTLRQDEAARQDTYRKMYQDIIKLWESVIIDKTECK